MSIATMTALLNCPITLVYGVARAHAFCAQVKARPGAGQTIALFHDGVEHWLLEQYNPELAVLVLKGWYYGYGEDLTHLYLEAMADVASAWIRGAETCPHKGVTYGRSIADQIDQDDLEAFWWWLCARKDKLYLQQVWQYLKE